VFLSISICESYEKLIFRKLSLFHFLKSAIMYLNDPNSYASWNIVLLVGSPKPDRLKDRGQTN